MISLLRNENYLGANLTIPHKERVGGYLDKIDPWAAKMGAVNTITKDGNMLTGHNTDGQAFLKSLKRSGRLRSHGEGCSYPRCRRSGKISSIQPSIRKC